MKVIKYDNAEKGQNSEECKTIEYDFKESDMDLGVATIKGRYPNEGYCMNLKCKELVYVINGEGFLFMEDKNISFSKGDAILLEPKEKYYWKSDYCEIAMICTPPWNKEQYELIK